MSRYTVKKASPAVGTASVEPQLGQNYEETSLVTKWTSPATSTSKSALLPPTKRTFNPFDTTRVTAAKKDGVAPTTYTVELLCLPEQVFFYGRTPYMLMEFSYPANPVQSASDESAAQGTIEGYSALLSAAETSIIGVFKNLYAMLDALPSSDSFGADKALHPAMLTILTNGGAEPSASVKLDDLKHITSGRLSIWFLTPHSLTRDAFTSNSQNNFNFSLTRSQLVATINALTSTFGVTCVRNHHSPASANSVWKDLITESQKKGSRALFSFQGKTDSYLPFSALLVYQFKEGQAGIGKEWDEKRKLMAQKRIQVEDELLSQGFPVLNIPTTVNGSLEAPLGNFQLHFAHCGMEDLLKLHELPLYVPGSTVLNPQRPKASVAKLATSASIQIFFFNALRLLSSPWSE